MKSRKDLKNKYKQRRFKLGVFQIRNTVNNKILVDGSTDLATIWNRQKFQLKSGLHPNHLLQSEWNEFGEEAFVFEILTELKQEDEKRDYRHELKELKEIFIEYLRPFDQNGYNIK